MTHTTADGKEVTNFTVAVNRKRKVQGQPEADFFRVAAWGRTGEICQQYLAKGRKVSVVGPVSVSTYTANDGSTRANREVFAEDVEFRSARDGAAKPAESSAPAGQPEPVATPDDLPF